MKLSFQRMRTIEEHTFIIIDKKDCISVTDYVTKDGNYIESVVRVNGKRSTSSRLIDKIDRFLTNNS